MFFTKLVKNYFQTISVALFLVIFFQLWLGVLSPDAIRFARAASPVPPDTSSATNSALPSEPATSNPIIQATDRGRWKVRQIYRQINKDEEKLELRSNKSS